MIFRKFLIAFSIVLTGFALPANASSACAPQGGKIDDFASYYYDGSGYFNGVWYIYGDYGRTDYQITIALSTPFRIIFAGRPANAARYDLDGPAGKIYRLYSLFSKKPDLEGLGYWLKDSENCRPIQDIALSFMGHPEYASIYGVNSTNEYFITTLYNKVLKRPPDVDGFNYWVGRLNSGMPRVEVVLSFTENEINKAFVYPDIKHGIFYLIYGAVPVSNLNHESLKPKKFDRKILKSPF